MPRTCHVHIYAHATHMPRTCRAQVDDHIMPSSADLAARTAREEAARGGADALSVPLVERLHAGGAGTMKSEFKSPPPSEGALNFARSGAAELSCFLRLIRHLGAAAPSLSATANSGSSIHVHVNVRSAVAGGDALSVPELLSVYFAWVQFDLVTARFARPWMWREPSMAPMYATGSEFAWHEKAWAQGGCTGVSAREGAHDLPRFLRAVREVLAEEVRPHTSTRAPSRTRTHAHTHTSTPPRLYTSTPLHLHLSTPYRHTATPPHRHTATPPHRHTAEPTQGFDALPEADKLERLFGRAAGTPASRIGRYCSLNLRRLTSYGTFEVRRFHGTLDPAVAVCWAHFCTAFVECFRGHGLWARLLGAANHDDAPRHGQSALGRSSPCGHPQLQKPTRLLRAGQPHVSPMGCGRSALAACMPKRVLRGAPRRLRRL